jgi:hypothetical protein
MLAVLLCAPAISHAGHAGYSMPAVCDYISARYYEADGLVAEGPGKATLQTHGGDIDIYRFEHNGETVEFFMKDGRRQLISVRRTGGSVPDEGKRTLLRRLGVNPSRVGNRFEAGCDMSNMALTFDGARVSEMRVWTPVD